ncbi:MAG TPA: deoxyribodipyrimidine photo-lyase [Candidatus Eisenbacteria bacterium]|nr:deoxyribodipyrimidine photo-lyase [Candidatus Eisenbacteria bacterium]
MTRIWWIRRDLRLADNQALAAALRGGGVIPVFVLDPALAAARQHRDAGRRRSFLLAGLRALDAELRARGSRLVVRTGPPAEVLAALVAASRAGAVVAEADVSPYARRRDAAVGRRVALEMVGAPGIRHPADVVKDDGTPYTVFTPFRKAWLARPLPSRRDLVAAPDRLPAVPAALASEPIPAGEAPSAFPAGETEARRRLDAFARGRSAPIDRYAAERDRVDRDGTSALSPYLRFGMVSARDAAVAALGRDGGARSGADVWLSELLWREFYLAILFHFPSVLREAFNPGLRDVPWRRAPGDLGAWQEGRTGYPIVDAAMRQLAATGWMHNRARMIVASFLTKDLLVDWRHGEAWFMRMLVDGDPAANNGGWQWTAGVGTDAAPYFRIFNPVLQARKFDPDGAYVRRWVPEVARVRGSLVHEPWALAPLEQQAAGCRVGRDYPAPIVDHHAARDRALAAYRRSQGRA